MSNPKSSSFSNATDLQSLMILGMPIWKELSGKRILIAGSSGFIGSHLVETLLYMNRAMALKMTLYGLSRSEVPPQGKDFIPVQGDLSTFQLDESLDFVIHTAGSSEWLSTEQDCSTYMKGSLHLLECAKRARVKRFLMVSSGAVDDFKLAEPYQAGYEYRRGKFVVESYMDTFRPFFDPVIARVFSVTGPGLPAHFAIHQFIQNGLKGGPIHLWGNGQSLRSYIYTTDLTLWLLTLLLKGKSCVPYNVGSNEPVTIAGLAKKIAHYFGTTVKQDPGIPQIRNYVPNTLKAKTNLHLEINVHLDKALTRTCDWFKKNQYGMKVGEIGTIRPES